MAEKNEDLNKAILDRLDKKIKSALAKDKISGFTKVQQLSFGKIEGGSNVLLISPTGSGKTLAAMLPIFNRWLKETPDPTSIMYISPMKSLNRDQISHLLHWANELEMEIAVRHGDTTDYERKRQQEFPNDMLIMTLEMIQSTITGKKIREHFRNVKFVIVDEVHEIVNSKRGVQLAVMLERLREFCGNFQLVMLSATVSEPEKVAAFLSGGRQVEIVETEEKKWLKINVVSPKSILQDSKIAESSSLNKDTAARLRTIIELVKNSRSTLLFTNTRDFAEILTSRLKSVNPGLSIEIHHSSLSKDVRVKAEKDFKEEKIKCLVCTSSLQLGIDIGSVDLVIQYMSPRRVVQILQRVGRSGHRLTEVSKGVIITTTTDDVFESAAIARMALDRKLEKIYQHEKSYDVLAHQIVGLTFDFGVIELEKAFEIIKRAYPYRNLNYSEFLETCKQLERLGIVFLNGYVKKRIRGFKYYFEQLSTIPTIKQYRIMNTIDNSFVGVLDEEFVALHGEENTNFIVKGQPWRILSVEDGKILVEPSSDTEASIPGWEGELIPVSFEVAQKVGEIRRKILAWLKEGRKAMEEVVKEYPVDKSCAEEMVNIVKKQKGGWAVPDENTVLIEDHEKAIVIHSCFGTTVNETLGRFVTAMLSSRIGTVGFKVDPYRIMIQTQQSGVDFIKDVILKTNPEHLQSYLEMSLSKSELFEWKFVHVAKRFGAISRDADFGKVTMKKIIEEYVGSPIYKETIKELETEKLDIERATDLMRRMQSGEIKLVVQRGLSPLGSLGLTERYSELVSPGKPEKEVLEIFKKRLLNSKVKLVCVNCGGWEQTFVVKSISDKIRCSKCGAISLAAMKSVSLNYSKFVKSGLKGNLKSEDGRRFKMMKKKADVFMTYRRLAVIALAARGVGPTAALRVLSKHHSDEDELFKDILDAERNFVKTKKYWSV